jgi:2-iminobutanoate/2-iminopropanoate deaminase
MLRIPSVALLLSLAACAHEAAKAPEPKAAPAPAPAARIVVQSAQAPKAIGPYSQAIEVPAGRFLFLAGQIPLDPATGQMVEGDTAAQAERVMQNLKAVLEAAGTGFDRVVKTTIFLTDLADFGKVNEIYARYFGQAPPARATVQVVALPRGSRVEIEAVAALEAAAGSPFARKVVQSAQAPRAIGPYSQAIDVTARRLIYLAGQIPLDPATGNMVEGDTAAQAERVMQNLKAVLEAAGAGFDKVVKTTIFLTDLADFGKVNEVYGRYFGEAPPARATVQAAALPRGSKVEIEAVAATDAAAGAAARAAIASAQAPKAIGPYSQAIETSAGRLVFCAGQIPLDPASGQMVEGETAAQAERVMQNLKAVLEAAGTGFDKVVKTTIFLTDLADFGKVNEVYGRHFGQAPPARATVQVAALPRGSKVEIEVVAAK